MTSGIKNYGFGLALLSGLSACNLITHPSHQQAAIKAYVVRTIDDPDSYQALWWGTPRAISRSDKAQMDRLAILRLYAMAKQKAQADSLPYLAATTPRLKASSPLIVPTEEAHRRFLQSASTRDSLRKVLRHLPLRKDTARYGYLIAHGYRVLNRSGQLFRDSALFLVDVEANVMVWDTLKKAKK